MDDPGLGPPKYPAWRQSGGLQFPARRSWRRGKIHPFRKKRWVRQTGTQSFNFDFDFDDDDGDDDDDCDDCDDCDYDGYDVLVYMCHMRSTTEILFQQITQRSLVGT